MSSLLVADDTPLIRSTIAHVVAQSKPEFYPVFEASSGTEAVELARQTKPDIILMDIKMPGLDGLQASAIIRAELPTTRIIILTAYDEFPYVQRAIKLGVVDYLLKPIRPATLAEILTQLHQQIEAERRQIREAVETKSYLEKTLPVVETSLVDRLVHGLDTDKTALETSLKYLGKTISWPAVLIAEVDSFETTKPESASGLFTEIAPQVLGETKTFLVGFSAPKRVIAIVSTDPSRPVIEQMRQLGDVIYHTLATKLGLTVTIGLGHHYPDLASIPLSYAEASLACRHGTGRVVHIDDVEDTHIQSKPAYPVQLEHKLLDSVRLGEAKTATMLLNDILDHLMYQFRERPDIIRSRLSELMALVARTIIGAGAAETDVLDLSHEQITALLATEEMGDMRTWALSSLAELITIIPAFTTAGENMVQQTLNYVQQNYHNPTISLSEVARAVSLSPSHLAHLLKERMGMSYKHYLTRVRIEAAKKLLRTTNLTIQAVAEAVGYQNVTNFYRLFQRETGVTPAAYRHSA
ncbi:MAG: response regulator [Anaerolineae bacterium]